MSLDNTLQKFSKFGEAANSRDLQIYIDGTAWTRPDPNAVQRAFGLDSWNVLDLNIVSPPSPQFLSAKVFLTARVFNQYSDTQVMAQAREIMSQFLNVSEVSIIKGKVTDKEIEDRLGGVSDFLSKAGWGLGLSTGTLIVLAISGLIVYKKVL